MQLKISILDKVAILFFVILLAMASLFLVKNNLGYANNENESLNNTEILESNYSLN